MNEFINTVLKEEPELREELLRSQAYNIDPDMVYSRNLTDSELGVLKEDYIQNNIKHSSFKDQLDAIKDEYKQKMRPLEELGKEKLNQLKTRQIEEEGEVFMIDDQEQKMMYYVNRFAEVVSSRPLQPSERQLTIHKAEATSN
jgi:hypothetical protein